MYRPAAAFEKFGVPGKKAPVFGSFFIALHRAAALIRDDKQKYSSSRCRWAHTPPPLCRAPRAERPTALLCHNDTIAITILRRLHECGLRVPEDLSLIGHDNVDLCERLVPTLTSVGYGSRELLARKLVDRVLERLACTEQPRSVEVLPPQLFCRESIGAPRI